jgi:hypothetical protein
MEDSKSNQSGPEGAVVSFETINEQRAIAIKSLRRLGEGMETPMDIICEAVCEAWDEAIRHERAEVRRLLAKRHDAKV